jgi:uncharacterized protein DUF5681
MPTERQYIVGKGKPPEHTRFQKGQSGNPTGRRKGSKNVATLLKQVLNERVIVTENGKRRRITKLEAMLKQLANKAASGDHCAIKMLMPLAETCIAPSSAASDSAAPLLLPSATERKALALETMKILKEVGFFEHTEGELEVDPTEVEERVNMEDSSEKD